MYVYEILRSMYVPSTNYKMTSFDKAQTKRLLFSQCPFLIRAEINTRYRPLVNDPRSRAPQEESAPIQCCRGKPYPRQKRRRKSRERRQFSSEELVRVRASQGGGERAEEKGSPFTSDGLATLDVFRLLFDKAQEPEQWQDDGGRCAARASAFRVPLRYGSRARARRSLVRRVYLPVQCLPRAFFCSAAHA